MNESMESLNELMEGLADIEHKRWSKWMRYLFSRCRESLDPINAEPNGDLIIPKEFVVRWMRQMNTDYKDLSEQEKESDREQVRATLKFIEGS